jgi:hypothetical protein
MRRTETDRSHYKWTWLCRADMAQNDFMVLLVRVALEKGA